MLPQTPIMQPLLAGLVFEALTVGLGRKAAAAAMLLLSLASMLPLTHNFHPLRLSNPPGHTPAPLNPSMQHLPCVKTLTVGLGRKAAACGHVAACICSPWFP
jgi:hypothetical protein